jgi:Leucine-rich repeat (LRR) protein
MNNLKEIFARYSSNQHLIDDYEVFLSYETNIDNEIISLSLFDSEYDDFPITDKIGAFIGEFKKLKQLEIDIYNQTITDLEPLIDLHNLEKIYIECTTKIKDLKFVQNMTQLKSIYLENSDIQDIRELSDKRYLTSIALPYSKIQDISPIRNLSELTFVNFNNNQIENIDSLQYARKLQTLYVSNNRIKSIRILQGLYGLTTISIPNNQIQDLSPIRYLNKIISLDIANNQISVIDFLDDFRELSRLNLANNQIIKISSIRSYSKLVYLNIADNLIENINFLSNNESLKELHISNNPINSVEVLSSLKALQTLFASHLNFQISADFRFQSKLINLDLSHCKLSSVDFLLNQEQIIVLNLSNNQIVTAIPYQFLKLTTIDLSGNEFGNKKFGKVSNNYKITSQETETTEKGTIQELQQIIADYFLEKGKIETALAIHYFDNSGYHSTISRQLLDVRIYLLKQLSKRNSPFVFNLQQKLLETLRTYFASTKEEEKLRADYLDIILNIEDNNVEKPTIKATNFKYFFHHRPTAYQAKFATTLEQLLAEEKKLLSDVIIKSEKRKRYERKTTSSDSSTEFAGCFVYILIVIVFTVMLFEGMISAEAVKVLAFIIGILKVIYFLFLRRS